MLDDRWELGKLIRIAVVGVLGTWLLSGPRPTEAAIRYDKRFYEISTKGVCAVVNSSLPSTSFT